MKVTAAAALNDLRQLQPEQLFVRASAVLPPWIAGVLVVGLAWKLAMLTWALVPQGDPRPVAKPPAGSPELTTDASAASAGRVVDDIIGQHVFGVFTKDAVVVRKDTDDLPVSDLYKLLGVYYSADPRNSTAIIADERGDADVYSIGQALGRGAKLTAIEPTRIAIDTEKGPQRVELPQEGDSPHAGPARAAARAPVRREPPPGSQTNEIEDAMNAAVAQQTPVTELIRPQPVFADGKQLGYRVYPGRNRQQFTKLGLKPGDLVTQINGAALDDPARGMEIFKVLEDGGQVSVTVERDGQPQVIVLDSSTISSLAEPSNE
jgi:general secretion pathway protein C